jgi:hypothetical protein
MSAMLSFPIESVRAVIARGRADAEANGGFRNPHYGLHPGRDERPGRWLVGDHGVYLCSNGALPDGKKPFVAYVLECDTRTNDDWFEVTVTPLGAISRLEHALSGFDVRQNQYRRRLEEAERRLVSYRSRDGVLVSARN